MKWIMSGLVTVACALGVYLLAAGLPDRPQEEVAPEGQELLKISASNFEFDKKQYEVKAGTTYQIKFTNASGRHGAEIQGLDVNLSADNPVMEFTFDKPGEYKLVCSIMCGQGHSTMSSTIIVT